MDIKEALKDSIVTGIHCSKCDFIIESVVGDTTNDDLFDATSLHHAKFHSGETGEEKTTSNIKAERRIAVPNHVTSVEMKLVAR